MVTWKVSLLGLSVVSLLLWLQIITWRRRLMYKLPPGPTPWPLVGNLVTIHRLHSDTERVLESLNRKYGGLCTLWLGSHPMIIISTALAAHDLLHKQGASTSSRPENSQLRRQIGRGRLVLTPAGPDFIRLRKIYHRLLKSGDFEKSRHVMDFESKAFLRELYKHPTSFYECAERYALSIIFTMTYGIRLESIKTEIFHRLFSVWNVLLAYFQPGTLLLPDTFPILLKLPTYLQPWHLLASRLINEELDIHRYLLKRLSSPDPTPVSNCYARLLLEWQKTESVDDRDVLGILAMIAGAGSDTTSSVLQNLFKVMALHPHIVDAAHDELDEKVGRDRLPTWEDEKQLPYLRALIKELHRWAPIGCLGIPHAANTAISYEDYSIPHGTILIPNLVTLNRDPDRYAQPEIFDPYRFKDDQLGAAASAVHPDYKKRDHFHYGFGRRLCLGVDMGEASIFIAISRILWAFDIRALPEIKLDMLDKIYGLATKPKPFEVSITPRNAAVLSIVDSELQQTDRTGEGIDVM